MQPEEKIYLSAEKLVAHFKKLGTPLPFSLSSMNKDRITGCLGGIPHRKIGGLCFYCPEEVLSWLAGLPIVQPLRHPALPVRRRGKPMKKESVEAARQGITVSELRSQQTVSVGV